MDKHFTDIELFEFANKLIGDDIKIKKIETHISTCKDCVIRLEEEKRMDIVLTSSLSVDYSIDVSKNVMNHFSAKQIVPMVDYNWIVYTMVGLVGALSLSSFSNTSLIDSIGFNIPQLSYAKVTVLALISILFMDLLSKYVKYKKQHLTS